MSSLPKVSVNKYETKLPVSGQKVTFTEFRGKDEKVILTANRSNDPVQKANAILDVLRNITFDIDIDDLPTADIELLLVRVREKSVGEAVEGKMDCSKCQKEFLFAIPLPEVKIEFPEKAENPFEVAKTDDGKSIYMELRYPFIGMDTNDKRAMKQVVTKLYDDDEVYDLNEISDDDFEAFLESLPAKGTRKIREFFNSVPTIAYEGKAKCPRCKTEHPYSFRGIEDFFPSSSDTKA